MGSLQVMFVAILGLLGAFFVVEGAIKMRAAGKELEETQGRGLMSLVGGVVIIGAIFIAVVIYMQIGGQSDILPDIAMP